MTLERIFHRSFLTTVRGSIVPNIWKQVTASIIFAILITWINQKTAFDLHEPSLISIVPGIVLGLLLVFRTNTANDRFWEGRKAIGTIIDCVRHLCRQIQYDIPNSSEELIREKQEVSYLFLALFLSVISQLRKEAPDLQVQSLISADLWEQIKISHNPPLVIGARISQVLDSWRCHNYIDSVQSTYYNQILDQALAAFGACERISGTPIPLAYTIHLKHLLIFYCFAVPFQLVGDLGWLTPVATGVISFAILGIEAVGLEIEDPFGHDPNDLPLDRLFQLTQVEIEEGLRLNPCNVQPSRTLQSEPHPI